MEGRLVFKDCALWRADGKLRLGQAVVVDGERITEVADNHQVPVRPGDWEVACRGRLLARAKSNGRFDVVAAQLGDGTSGMGQRRESLLTHGELEALSAHGFAEALLSGVGWVVSELHCPLAIREGLDLQARLARRLGLRVVLAHGPSGDEGLLETQLRLNAAFVAEQTADAWVRPALGMGDPSTWSEAWWREASKQIVSETPLVFSRAHDSSRGLEARGKAFEKLLDAKWIHDKCLVAVDVREEPGALTTLLYSPAQIVWMTDKGLGAVSNALAERALLGGEGWPRPVWRAMDALKNEEKSLWQLLEINPSRCRQAFYQDGSVGIEPGGLADLVVRERVLSTVDTLSWSTWLDIEQSRIAWTIVNGKVAVREGQLLGADATALARDAAMARASVTRRAGVSSF